MDIEANRLIDDLLHGMANAMGMHLSGEAGSDCGYRYIGDGKTTSGYMWFYVHEDLFAVTKCDFVFCSDCTLHMPLSSRYIVLRLDYANHLPPGKIVSYMEENGQALRSTMRRGTRVAYTETMYFPVFYRKHLETSFPSLKEDPVEILRNMTGEHNWPSDMHSILSSIQSHDSFREESKLYYVGKAYELMASLLAMGAQRAPRNELDYFQLRLVIAYIDKHVFENIKQQELLRIASMSPTKLKTLFRQFTGLSITNYIASQRVDRAMHLLSDTALAVEEIATATGFETASGFTTFFKKHAGIAPTVYRSQMKFYCLKNPSDKGVFSLPSDSL